MDLKCGYEMLRDRFVDKVRYEDTTGEQQAAMLRRIKNQIVNPLDQESIDESFSRPVTLPDVIYPLERVLLHTLDYVEIPPDHVGFVELRSTFARMGLIIPPTYADPGFYGTLTMEVFNTNKRPIQLYPGLAMWSIVISPCIDEPLYTQENGARYTDQGQHIVTPIALPRSYLIEQHHT